MSLLNKSMHRASTIHKQRHFYHLLKSTKLRSLLHISIWLYIKANQKENANNVHSFTFTEAATKSCSLKKVFTICPLWSKNPLVFSMTLILTMNILTIEELFAEHRFLKNTSAWLLLRSKFYSEYYSMFCLHKVRMLQKGFSQLTFTWSVKWWV